MKKILTFSFTILLLLAALTACAGTTASKTAADDTASASADLALETFTSSFGYTMAYDPHLFYVLTDDSSDNFEFIEANPEETPPVYVAVQRLSGYTVAEYTKILEDQSTTGVYSVTETRFGADQRKAVTVTYEETTSLGVAYYEETVVKVGSDLLYIEIATYRGMEGQINTAIDKMLETFSVEN